MSTSDIIYLLITGTLAGIVSGFFGVGGGIIIVPALVLIFGFTQHMAQGTSLAVLLFPVGMFAVYNYYKHGSVNFKYAAILIVVFILGSYIGSKLALNIPDKMLKRVFGLLMFLVGLRMMLKG